MESNGRQSAFGITQPNLSSFNFRLKVETKTEERNVTNEFTPDPSCDKSIKETEAINQYIYKNSQCAISNSINVLAISSCNGMDMHALSKIEVHECSNKAPCTLVS